MGYVMHPKENNSQKNTEYFKIFFTFIFTNYELFPTLLSNLGSSHQIY